MASFTRRFCEGVIVGVFMKDYETVTKSMEKTFGFVYNPCQVLQGLILCPRAKLLEKKRNIC